METSPPTLAPPRDTDEPRYDPRHHPHRPEIYGYLAEFTDVAGVVAAAKKIRDAGFTQWDVHSPFPIHGIDKAMGAKPTMLPFIVLGGGVLGFFAGLLLSWWTNAVDYPYFISGKPVWSFAANIPVIFETTVLFAAFAAVFGMLVMNKLPLLYHPLFKHRRFRRATNDRFFIVIEAIDPLFSEEKTRQLLAGTGPAAIEEVFEED